MAYLSNGQWVPDQYTTYAGTNVTASGAYGFPQQMQAAHAYAPPATWHNFPCGHQIKLEPGQPAPMRCNVCPAPERKTHEYRPCGHVYTYDTAPGFTVPSACPTCVQQKYVEEQAAKKLSDEREAERALREAEDKEPIAWLDKELRETGEMAFA